MRCDFENTIYYLYTEYANKNCFTVTTEFCLPNKLYKLKKKASIAI